MFIVAYGPSSHIFFSHPVIRQQVILQDGLLTQKCLFYGQVVLVLLIYESHHPQVSILLLSLQMIADGIAIDSYSLLRIKVHLAQVTGFRDVTVMPSQSGQSFQIHIGDIGEIPEIALPCINQLLRVFDAPHPIQLNPWTMVGRQAQDERVVSILVGSVFVDMFLVMFCSVKDSLSLPLLTFKSMLETLCVIIYKHDFESTALKHLQKTLRHAVLQVLNILSEDISYDLRQLALSITQAFIKRWPTFMGSTV